MYCCNFDLKDKQGNIISTCRGGSCFSQIYSNGKMNDNDFLHVYALKSYENTYYKEGDCISNKMSFTKEELETYIAALNEIGFNVSLKENTIDLKITQYGEPKKIEVYEYVIDLKKNTSHANYILVNLLRHTYENSFPTFINWFLESLKEKSKVTIFERFIMSFCAYSGYSTGHTCVMYSRPLILDEKKQREIIFGNKRVVTGTQLIKITKYTDAPHKFVEIINDKKLTLSQKKDKYITECAKYM